MKNPFLELDRPVCTIGREMAKPGVKAHVAPGHATRKHSKFAASAAERWLSCPGSVELSEGIPDKGSIWAIEGTRAHEVLESVLLWFIEHGDTEPYCFAPDIPLEMRHHAVSAAQFIYRWGFKLSAEVLVETRIYLDFIRPEMFGTFDGAVVDHFGTLHVFDYKYGAGHAVSPVNNLQMAFYGIGLAHKYHWNFKAVRLWIIQPRIKGYDGPTFWDVPIEAMRKNLVPKFEKGVRRVEKYPDVFVEGSHCRWCKAKSVCPLKRSAKLDAAKAVFNSRQK